MKLDEVSTVRNTCPHCGYFSDCVTGAFEDEIKPEEGDMSICVKCCEGSWFDENLKLIQVDTNDMDGQEYSKYIRVKQACNEIKEE